MALKRNGHGTLYEEVDDEIIAKECKDCSTLFPISDFYKLKSGLAGRGSYCKTCAKARATKSVKAQYGENPEKFKERALKWREENKERDNEYRREYYKQYRTRNIDRIRNYIKPEKMRQYNLARRARKRNTVNTLNSSEIQTILDTFNGRCALSGNSENIHLDHFIPLKTGHSGTVFENMIPLRSDLNQSKNAQNPFEWFAENKERFGIERRKFDEVVEYLSDLNGMTPTEYRDYVYECFANPRRIINAEMEGECA